MFFWHGAGILVVMICVASLAATQAVTQSITGGQRYYDEHGWVVLVSWLLAATLTYGLHRLLLRRKEQVVIDKETGEEFTLKSNDSLFLVPVRWWPIVLVAFGLISAFDGPKTSAQANPSNQSVSANRKLKWAGECGLRGDYATAIRLATEVIDRHPSNGTAYMLRGTAHRRSGEYSQAIADLDRAIELDAQNSFAYTQRASAYQQSGTGDCSTQILADSNRAIELDAANPLAHIIRGNEYAALNDHDAAIADYDQAVRLNPNSYSALAGRGSSNMSLGRLDEARRDLQKALDLHPPAGERRQIEELLQSVESGGE
jgi:tetratricopeptide (TPR) repeat protein